MYRPIPLLALILATGLAAGCGDDDTPTTPTPTPTAITEIFPAQDTPGVLMPNGGVTHVFTVQRAGEVQATLAVTPAEAVVGLSLGPMTSQACSAAIARDNATNATSILGNATTNGSFCVRVYDAGGTLTAPVSYTITVQHF